MFRVDGTYVVDATMCGNAARFINHSCEVRALTSRICVRVMTFPGPLSSVMALCSAIACVAGARRGKGKGDSRQAQKVSAERERREPPSRPLSSRLYARPISPNPLPVLAPATQRGFLLQQCNSCSLLRSRYLARHAILLPRPQYGAEYIS